MKALLNCARSFPHAVRTLTLLIRDPLPRDWPGWASSLPALEFILSRGHAAPTPFAGSISWLCHRFGLTPSPDWPLAAILARSAGLPFLHPYWLCADPVYVDVHPQQMSVVRAGDLNLTAEQSARLIEALDRQFASRGIHVAAFDRTRWLINVPAAIRLDSGPPDSRDHGRRVTVSGEHGSRWNAFLTEVQMLLHEHPVNQAREASGELPINSLYLWGSAGPAALLQPVDTLSASDDVLTLALTGMARMEAHRDLAGALASLAALRNASVLAVPASEEKALAERERMSAVDRHWLAPALQALKDRALDRIDLVVDDHAARMNVYTLTRRAFWEFWKRRRLAARPPEA